MRRRCALLAFLTLLVCSALLAPHALAQGTLDQSLVTPTPSAVLVANPTTTAIGQTFTAGLTGLLDSAALDLNAGTVPTTATVTLYAATGVPPAAVPTGAPLATATISVTQSLLPQTAALYTTAVFTPAAPVVAGQVYALVLGPIATPLGILGWGESTLPYARGNLISSPSGTVGSFTAIGVVNLNFQTFVTAGTASTSNFPATTFRPLTPGANFDPRCSFGCGPGGLP